MSSYISLPGGVIEAVHSEGIGLEGLNKWSEWYETSHDKPFVDGGRRVALTKLPDGSEVSTVFLSIDHNFGRGSEPILFETMVFGGPHNEEQVRYRTWQEAVAGHDKLVGELTTEIESRPHPEVSTESGAAD